MGGAGGSLARSCLAGMVDYRAHRWGTVGVKVPESLLLGILIGVYRALIGRSLG